MYLLYYLYEHPHYSSHWCSYFFAFNSSYSFTILYAYFTTYINTHYSASYPFSFNSSYTFTVFYTYTITYMNTRTIVPTDLPIPLHSTHPIPSLSYMPTSLPTSTPTIVPPIPFLSTHPIHLPCSIPTLLPIWAPPLTHYSASYSFSFNSPYTFTIFLLYYLYEHPHYTIDFPLFSHPIPLLYYVLTLLPKSTPTIVPVPFLSTHLILYLQWVRTNTRFQLFDPHWRNEINHSGIYSFKSWYATPW
jgi:hypothetical protein